MKLKPIASNMTEVETDVATILFSYSTPVACCMNTFVPAFFKTTEYFSVTTSRHINKWLAGHNFTLMPQSFFDNLV